MKRNKYLLDTNICIALLRGGNRNVATRLIEAGEGNCSLSVITVYELMFGAYHSQHESSEVPKVRLLTEHFPLIPLLDSAEEYAILKTRLRAAGTPIDDFDLMIAATALTHNLVLVTDNTKHFQRITGLRLENWIR